MRPSPLLSVSIAGPNRLARARCQLLPGRRLAVRRRHDGQSGGSRKVKRLRNPNGRSRQRAARGLQRLSGRDGRKQRRRLSLHSLAGLSVQNFSPCELGRWSWRMNSKRCVLSFWSISTNCWWTIENILALVNYIGEGAFGRPPSRLSPLHLSNADTSI